MKDMKEIKMNRINSSSLFHFTKSFDILKKISFIQEEVFNKISTDDITSIVNAVKRGVDNSQIYNY